MNSRTVWPVVTNLIKVLIDTSTHLPLTSLFDGILDLSDAQKIGCHQRMLSHFIIPQLEEY